MSGDPEDEVRNVMDSYGKIIDVWKVHNDNYFKRVQILMGLLQVGLFLALLKLLSPMPKSFAEAVIPTFLGILGIFSAGVWLRLNKKQSQYLEFCRTTLRNLEHRLGELGVPLEYFTCEALVFGPYRKQTPKLLSAAIETVEVAEKGRHKLIFGWSQELYPKSGKGLHSISEVSGGMISCERRIAQIAVGVWAFVIAVTLLAALHPSLKLQAMVCTLIS